VTKQTDEKTLGRDEAGIWEGEEIRLERTWGDQWLQGLLGWTVVLPAKHVHPPCVRSPSMCRARSFDMTSWLRSSRLGRVSGTS
jgi:hypothetical protein